MTGSGRLDLYRFSGDSLQGRYHLIRVHPFSVAELRLSKPAETLDLLRLGGFPEPWLSGSEKLARRWSREHRSRLVEEDMAGLEQIRSLGEVQLLMLSLPARVGSPLSVHNLAQQLRVSDRTISRWLDAAERLYAIFRVPPFGPNLLRAASKRAKHYHLDWTVVPEDGFRFENLVACHLLKWIHWRQDTEGEDLDLHYFRDRDGREVDFVVSDGPMGAVAGGVQMGRRRGQPGPSLPSPQVPGGRRLANLRHRAEGLPDGRRDPGSAGAGTPVELGIASGCGRVDRIYALALSLAIWQIHSSIPRGQAVLRFRSDWPQASAPGRYPVRVVWPEFRVPEPLCGRPRQPG